MRHEDAKTLTDIVKQWAIPQENIRAMALAGSWARGNPHANSDLDLLLVSPTTDKFRDDVTWLGEISFGKAGYTVTSSRIAEYGVVWSRHISLQPSAEVEMTFADCSWCATDPIDAGTYQVVGDGFQIIFDKDGALARLVRAVLEGQ